MVNPVQRALSSLDDPRTMRRLNGWLTLFWIAAIPVSYALGWLRSVVYVSALSLWALVAGHLSTWQAARVEVRQERERLADRRDPVEDRVVRKLEERARPPHHDADENGDAAGEDLDPRMRFW